jgi:hypothetical protein
MAIRISSYLFLCTFIFLTACTGSEPLPKAPPTDEAVADEASSDNIATDSPTEAPADSEATSAVGETQRYFADEDGDGYGNPDQSTSAPELPAGYVTNDQDCNDDRADVHPEAEDPPYDGIDQDCDGYYMDLPATTNLHFGDLSTPFIFSQTWSLDETAQQASRDVTVEDPALDPRLAIRMPPVLSIRYGTGGHILRKELRFTTIRGDIFSVREREYNEQGQLIMYKQGETPDLTILRFNDVHSYSYHDDGSLAATKVYDGEPDAPGTVTRWSGRWTYNDTGQLQRFEFFNDDFESLGATVRYTDFYIYNEAGRLWRHIRHDGTESDPILWAGVYTYDDPLTFKGYSGDPDDPTTPITRSIKMFYDDAGNQVRYENYYGDFDDPATSLDKRYQMTYDEHGNRLSIDKFDGATPFPSKVVVLSYDDQHRIESYEIQFEARTPVPALAILGSDEPPYPEEPQLGDHSWTARDYFPVPFDEVPIKKLDARGYFKADSIP